jgi:phenylacetyl-CoA:acceptor oxidoreductase subunit 2
MELIRPVKQTVWRWPAVANFSLGGMGAGFYLLVVVLQGSTLSQSLVLKAMFELLGPALVSLGFLSLVTEAGRPLRGYNLFRHLRRSWMSRETLVGGIFILAAVAHWSFPHPALHVLAAAGAVGLMISQGFMVYRARAVTAWNVSLIPFFFVTSGLATGSGLMLLLVALGGQTLERGFLVVGLACVILNLVLWALYLRWPDDAFQDATTALRHPNALLLTVDVGHLLPALLLILVLALPGLDTGIGFLHAVIALAGLAMVSSGVSQKAGIILEVSYLRALRF